MTLFWTSRVQLPATPPSGYLIFPSVSLIPSYLSLSVCLPFSFSLCLLFLVLFSSLCPTLLVLLSVLYPSLSVSFCLYVCLTLSDSPFLTPVFLSISLISSSLCPFLALRPALCFPLFHSAFHSISVSLLAILCLCLIDSPLPVFLFLSLSFSPFRFLFSANHSYDTKAKTALHTEGLIQPKQGCPSAAPKAHSLWSRWFKVFHS